MNLKQLIALFSITLILLSCAQIVPLTGGDRDVTAPKEIESLPKNGSTNFTAKTITVEFDEFIKLTNVSSQLIVSPLIEPTPEVMVKGKKLVIKLKSELAQNTTYSLNFGNAISDITENNDTNYKYVFSTGTYIDSLSYSGTVVDAFDFTEKEKVYVLLYDQLEDSVPLKELPRYVAMTDKNGKFSITNIANGEYKFFAINDINGNYLYDLPNEEIGFKKEKITLSSSSADNVIYLFEEEGGKQYVVKVEHKEFGKIDMVLNLPTTDLRITPVNITPRDSWFIEEKNETGDSITMWLTATNDIETLQFSIADGEEIIDTLEVDLITELKDSSYSFKNNVTALFDLGKTILLTANRPIVEESISSINLYEDSLKVQFNIKRVAGRYRHFEISYPFKENTNYQLFIPPDTFEDIYGLKNDTVKIDFKTKKLSDYGIINYKITPNFPNQYILQLYKKDKLIKESILTGGQKGNYEYLLPGEYELKLIIDSNKDGKWNTGKYLDGLQPEKVIYYEKDIKIRANWDNEIIWTINE